jgi:hypothetical protein
LISMVGTPANAETAVRRSINMIRIGFPGLPALATVTFLSRQEI